MRIVIGALALLLAAAPTGAQQAGPGRLAGTWTVDVLQASLVLEVSGGQLTGTVVNRGVNRVPMSEVRVDGDEVVIVIKVANDTRTITLTGTVKGDEIAFVRQVQVQEGAPAGGAGLLGASGPMDFVARRASPETDVWSGTIRNAPTRRNQTPNANPRSVSLSTRMMATPHWRWRGGGQQIGVQTFTLPMGSFPLDSFDLSANRLAFSLTRANQGDQIACTLARQPEGAFVGTCQSSGGGFNVLITLSPPAAAATGARE